MSKRPSFQFYPGDWIKDPALRRCTKAEKGVWIDMLCLMHECEDYGVLSTGDMAWSDREIAGAIGGDISENLSCISELLRKGVAHRSTKTEAIFCKRMTRDEQKRKLCSEAGKKGGNPLLSTKNEQRTLKGAPKGAYKGGDKGALKPNLTPSSSSSSSTTKLKDQKLLCISRKPEIAPVDAKFDLFWKAYPVKQNKKKALEVWKRKRLDEKAEIIVADVCERQTKHRQWLEGFVPHPTTYLNGERWNDEITELGYAASGENSATSRPRTKSEESWDRMFKFAGFTDENDFSDSESDLSAKVPKLVSNR